MSNHEFIIDFVLSRAATEPVPKRIRLYRSLAEFCGDEKEIKSLNEMADNLAAAEARCREFAFHFSQKSGE